MTNQTNQARFLAKSLLELDKISLHHVVQLYPDQARCFANVQLAESKDVGTQTGYGITAYQTTRLIRLIDSTIPRMEFGNLNGEPNPNNGKTVHTYKIGRAYSRVIYVTVPHLYFPEAKRAGILSRIEADLHVLADHYQADEFDVEKSDYSTTIRFWWD